MTLIEAKETLAKALDSADAQYRIARDNLPEGFTIYELRSVHERWSDLCKKAIADFDAATTTYVPFGFGDPDND